MSSQVFAYNIYDWDRLPEREATEVAKNVARELPSRFVFRNLETYSLVGQQHRMASFTLKDTHFVLIPGGEISIGFDSSDWCPTAEEQDSWEQTLADGLELEPDLPTYLSTITTPPRTAVLPPALVETSPREVGWTPVSTSHPRVEEAVYEHYNPSPMVAEIIARRGGRKYPTTFTIGREEGVFRVRIDADGAVFAEENTLRTHAEVISHVRQAGFRLPTCDEWEYYCGGGEKALFRWGDHVPCDRYPEDISPEEAQWQTDWVLSGGELSRPAEPFESDWNFHRMPNAFGLMIANGVVEHLMELHQSRGGDGGVASCGGEGFLKGWFPLATAYCGERICHEDPSDSRFPSVPVCRRVLHLS